ncbi:MAG: hypothetical protein IJZ07_02590 [Clostridia bacterium]|nr:hypothetical protein [Clostridia bacterium]
MKKFTAVLTAFLILFAFASCKDDGVQAEKKTEIVTDNAGEAVTNDAGEKVTKLVEETQETSLSTAVSSTAPETTLAPVSIPSTDPSAWTKEQIVEFYKTAAINSKSQKSVEKKVLSEMVVNDGDGLLGTLVEWSTPFLIKALEDSQVEFDGITGGYEDIVPEDAQTAKAYKSGDYIVVEMKMKEQTDGIHGDRYSGTVGHAISVVGDISSVEEALAEWFAIDFENADIKLRYTEPTVKVKINKDGIIEKGTWSYVIKITVSNLFVEAVNFPISAMVESAYGSVDYVITVGGGF